MEFDLKKVYQRLDEIEQMPDMMKDEATAKLSAYIALRRDLERFLIQTTGTL